MKALEKKTKNKLEKNKNKLENKKKKVCDEQNQPKNHCSKMNLKNRFCVIWKNRKIDSAPFRKIKNRFCTNLQG